MRSAIIVAVCCSVAGLAIGASTPPKKAATPQKKAPVTATQPKKSAATTNKTPLRRPVTTRRYTARPPVRRVVTPQQPTTDRYREIQDALASKGYLTTPSTGVWDKDSMAAMQRFQQAQNLEPTGKLTARSLVALGLGPKNPATTVFPQGDQ